MQVATRERRTALSVINSSENAKFHMAWVCARMESGSSAWRYKAVNVTQAQATIHDEMSTHGASKKNSSILWKRQRGEMTNGDDHGSGGVTHDEDDRQKCDAAYQIYVCVNCWPLSACPIRKYQSSRFCPFLLSASHTISPPRQVGLSINSSASYAICARLIVRVTCARKIRCK